MLLFDSVIPAEFSNVGSAGNLPIIPPPTAEFSIMRPFNIPDSVFRATLEPRFPITAALLYVFAVGALNKYNRSRDAKPWSISKRPWFSKFVIMHNSLLAVYSAWTFCGMVGVLRRTLVSPGGAAGLSATYDSLCRIHGPAGLGRSIYYDETLGRWTSVDAEVSFAAMNGTYPLSMPSGRIWSEGMAYYGWLFYVSKLYELLDTFIILAKGKESSFLQIYHHSGVLVGTWLGYRVMASPAWILVFLNSFVHSLMYTYYVSRGISIRVPIAIKQSLTLLQIVQFVVGGVFGVIHFFIEFDNPTIAAMTKLYGDDDASPSIISAEARQPCMISSTERLTAALGIVSLIPLTWLFVMFFISNYLKNHPRKVEFQKNRISSMKKDS
ncbi:hypothetical protein NHJ6243_009834 [Beauveria neobassiana]